MAKRYAIANVLAPSWKVGEEGSPQHVDDSAFIQSSFSLTLPSFSASSNNVENAKKLSSTAGLGTPIISIQHTQQQQQQQQVTQPRQHNEQPIASSWYNIELTSIQLSYGGGTIQDRNFNGPQQHNKKLRGTGSLVSFEQARPAQAPPNGNAQLLRYPSHIDKTNNHSQSFVYDHASNGCILDSAGMMLSSSPNESIASRRNSASSSLTASPYPYVTYNDPTNSEERGEPSYSSSCVLTAVLNPSPKRSNDGWTFDEEEEEDKKPRRVQREGKDSVEATYIVPNPNNGNSSSSGLNSGRRNQRDEWRKRLQEMVQFRDTHGHCLVPPQDNPKLFQWVKRQRYQFKLKHLGKASALSDERERLLTETGFVWNSQEIGWRERLERLKEYRVTHGNCNVPYNYGDKALAIWVKSQRRQYKLWKIKHKASTMNAQRAAELDVLEFDWNPRRLMAYISDSSEDE